MEDEEVDKEYRGDILTLILSALLIIIFLSVEGPVLVGRYESLFTPNKLI